MSMSMNEIEAGVGWSYRIHIETHHHYVTLAIVLCLEISTTPFHLTPFVARVYIIYTSIFIPVSFYFAIFILHIERIENNEHR